MYLWPFEVAKLLLDRGARYEEVEDSPRTPLHAACELGVRLLVDQHANLEARSEDGDSPLQIASTARRSWC